MYEYPHNGENIAVVQFAPTEPFFAVDAVPEGEIANASKTLGAFTGITGRPMREGAKNVQQKYALTFFRLHFYAAALYLIIQASLFDESYGSCPNTTTSYYKAIGNVFMGLIFEVLLDGLPAIWSLDRTLFNEKTHFFALSLITYMAKPIAWPVLLIFVPRLIEISYGDAILIMSPILNDDRNPFLLYCRLFNEKAVEVQKWLCGPLEFCILVYSYHLLFYSHITFVIAMTIWFGLRLRYSVLVQQGLLKAKEPNQPLSWLPSGLIPPSLISYIQKHLIKVD
jgi:hypothetical protein